MKILMATNGLDIGGAETHIVELAKGLRRQGHKILVVSAGGVYVKELEEAGIRHIQAPLNSRSPLPMYRSYQILKQTIRAEKPDVVHAHARIPGFLCGLIRKGEKFAFVGTAHWVFASEGMVRYLTNWGEKTIAVSEDIKQYLKDSYGVPSDDVFVTINGIDTERFSPKISGESVKAEFGIPKGVPVLTHVSRMDESRALAARHLIDLAPALCEKVEGLTLLLVGGGDVFEELNAKAEEQNRKIGRRAVIMTGPRSDINLLVAAGDVFVGVSRAALEAMSAAKPTLVAGNEGYLGIFTPDNLERAVASNFCCRGDAPIDSETMKKDILALLALSDTEKAERGAYCRQVISEHYSVERMTQDALKAYHAALKPRKILVSGYYGYANAGDEAILEALCQSIRRTAPGTGITVLSGNPAVTEENHGCRAVKRFSPKGLWRAVRDCDTLISGGGSLLQDATSTRSLLYYLLVIRLAERMGKQVFLLANGIGPVRKKANRRLVARAVKNAKYITLRDPESMTELQRMGVERSDLTVTADPVYLLEAGEDARAREALRAAGIGDEPFFAVSVRPWKQGNEALERKVAEICDGVARRYGLKPLFIPMQQGVDDIMAQRMMGKMTEKGYLLEHTPKGRDIMAVMGRSELALTMRLHSLIFAAKMEIPSVGISYDPKLDANLKLLGQPSAGSVAELDTERALALIGQTLEQRERRVAELRETVAELTKSALQNEVIIQNL